MIGRLRLFFLSGSGAMKGVFALVAVILSQLEQKTYCIFAGMRKIIIILSAALMLAACKTGTETDINERYAQQAVELPGISNARQLGGYAIDDSKVRMDVLLRSGNLSKASDEALATLHDKYNLALVADFRSSIERGNAHDRAVDGAQNVWFPILEKRITDEDASSVMMSLHLNKDNPSYVMELLQQPDIQEALKGSYDTIVFEDDCRHSYAAFLDSLVALPEGRAALWHCTHGKDRCGWGTAFVLAALGADRSLIVDDFAMSNISYAEDIEELASIARVEGREDEMIEYIRLLRGVSAVYFEKTLDLIDARFGSIDNYLEQALDLTLEEKQILRVKFLVK